jgi:cellulose biosynthesis protein BcsQ
MIILIGSEKGGVGKSTLATNISALLTQQGKDVILVDSDRQSTSANWAKDRLETNKKKIECVRQRIKNGIACCPYFNNTFSTIAMGLRYFTNNGRND